MMRVGNDPPARRFVDGGDAFIGLRDRLLRPGLGAAAARSAFRWPAVPSLNWALDYFDRIAVGNESPALSRR
jgi:acetyl-CoA synthetase